MMRHLQHSLAANVQRRMLLPHIPWRILLHVHVQIHADLIRRRERVFRDREHRDIYDDVDFSSQYRLRRATVMNIIDGLRDGIQFGQDGRNRDLTPTLKSLLYTLLRQFPDGIWRSAWREYVGRP